MDVTNQSSRPSSSRSPIAEPIPFSSPPTPADKQTSANNLATMHDPARKQGVIDESTQSAAAAA